MRKDVKAALDAMIDKVLAYRPEEKQKRNNRPAKKRAKSKRKKSSKST